MGINISKLVNIIPIGGGTMAIELKVDIELIKRNIDEACDADGNSPRRQLRIVDMLWMMEILTYLEPEVN
jgi:hypothetical protein